MFIGDDNFFPFSLLFFLCAPFNLLPVLRRSGAMEFEVSLCRQLVILYCDSRKVSCVQAWLTFTEKCELNFSFSFFAAAAARTQTSMSFLMKIQNSLNESGANKTNKTLARRTLFRSTAYEELASTTARTLQAQRRFDAKISQNVCICLAAEGWQGINCRHGCRTR